MGAMAQQICLVLSTAERAQLAALAADRNPPRKLVERARIVFASADRYPVQRVAQSIGVSRPVWRWQQRFAEAGLKVERLLRDKTRKPVRRAQRVRRQGHRPVHEPLDRTQPGLPMKRGRCGTITKNFAPPRIGPKHGGYFISV